MTGQLLLTEVRGLFSCVGQPCFIELFTVADGTASLGNWVDTVTRFEAGFIGAVLRLGVDPEDNISTYVKYSTDI